MHIYIFIYIVSKTFFINRVTASPAFHQLTAETHAALVIPRLPVGSFLVLENPFPKPSPEKYVWPIPVDGSEIPAVNQFDMVIYPIIYKVL